MLSESSSPDQMHMVTSSLPCGQGLAPSGDVLILECGGKVLRDAAFVSRSIQSPDKAASRSTLPSHSKIAVLFETAC
jgi:hypothetical protein